MALTIQSNRKCSLFGKEILGEQDVLRVRLPFLQANSRLWLLWFKMQLANYSKIFLSNWRKPKTTKLKSSHFSGHMLWTTLARLCSALNWTLSMPRKQTRSSRRHSHTFKQRPSSIFSPWYFPSGLRRKSISQPSIKKDLMLLPT